MGGERTWVRQSGPLGALEADWSIRYWQHAVDCFADTATFVYPWDACRIEDGWMYARVPDEPAESIEARRAAYAEEAAAWLDKGTDHWEAVARPEVVARLARMRRTRPRSDSPSLASLARHLEICMDEGARIMGYVHWSMVGGFGVDDWPTVFAEVTARPAVEAADCLQGLPHETDRLVRRLRRLARLQRAGDAAFDRELAGLLARYGRRTGNGYGSSVTFASPTWSIDPSLALAAIRDYARSDIDGAEHRERAVRRARGLAWKRLRASYATDPVVLARLERAHDVGARRIRAMEDHNHLMEQETTGTVREAIHRVGLALVAEGRIDKPTDVLSLSLAELQSLPARPSLPSGDLRELVAERKAERRARMENPPPAYYGPPPPELSIDIASRHDGEPSAEPGVIVGVAASPGRATGRAVVATDAQLPPEIEPGDVLVARDAGPAWTPVFPLLAAVVLDAGAAYQHAALVAREFGIPAVLGTVTATKDIAHGAMVTVDGTAGRVVVSAPV